MAIVATYTQQPADKLDYDVYYADAPDGSPDWLGAGDSITDAVVTVSPVGLTVTDITSANRIKLWASGGTSGTTYKITMTITTTEGRIKQDELRLKVREV